MTLSKKMKEILAGFWSLMNRYEEAHESGDREAALRYGEEILGYCLKYQKELNFSDEYLAGMRKTAREYKNSVAEEKILEAELAELRGRKAINERKYFKALREDEKKKKIKWN